MSTDVQRSQAGRRRHLMIVDDERDTTKSMSILLRLDGYNVQAFHNGKDAIHALMSSTPDAVLLDIGCQKWMPMQSPDGSGSSRDWNHSA